MPDFDEVTVDDILSTYQDTYDNAIAASNNQTNAEIVGTFFGDPAFEEKLEKQFKDMNGLDDRGRFFAVVVLAKQKAAEELNRSYSLESLADLSDPEKNPDDIVERTKQILEDLVKDPELEKEEKETDDEFRERVNSEKNRRFNKDFYMPEAEKFTGKLQEYLKSDATILPEQFEDRIRPYGLRTCVQGLFDGFNQFFAKNYEGVPDERQADTEVRIQAMMAYTTSYVRRDEGFRDAYDSLRQGMEPGDNAYSGMLGAEAQGRYLSKNLANYMASVSVEKSAEKKRTRCDEFQKQYGQELTAFSETRFSDQGLLSQLSATERAVFLMDPRIRREMDLPSTIQLDGKITTNITYRGIDLQMHQPGARLDPQSLQNLQDLKKAIADSYNLHITEKKLAACTDLGGDSLKNLADAMTMVEENLNRNSEFLRSSGEYRDMQSALKDFRKYAESLSQKGRDLTKKEEEKLADYLTKAYGAANTYLDKKGGQTGRTNYKSQYELGRVEAARGLAEMLEKTSSVLSKAKAVTEERQNAEAERQQQIERAKQEAEHEKQMEGPRAKARRFMKIALKNVPDFKMTEEQQQEFLSDQRISRRNPADEMAGMVSENVNLMPLEYMTTKQRNAFFRLADKHQQELKLSEDDIDVLTYQIQRLNDREARREEEKGRFKFTEEDRKILKERGDQLNKELNDSDAGYANFIWYVRAARNNMLEHLEKGTQYTEFARDMKLLILHEESRHPNARYGKEQMKDIMSNIGNNDKLFNEFVDKADLGEEFNNLIANTTPQRDKDNHIVNNKENALKAMHSFLIGDGVEKLYQKYKEHKASAVMGEKSPIQKKMADKIPEINPMFRK